MDLSRVRELLRGVLVYTVTPFRDESGLPVDLSGLRSNIRFLIERDINAIVPCGGTGEYWSLTPGEVAEVIRTAQAAAGEDALVMPGVGRSLPEALQQTAVAEQAGCGGVMLFTPPGKFSETGHLAYVRAVAQRTAVGVMPYLAAPVSRGFLESLLEIPNVVAIKDATGDVGWFRRSIRLVQGRVNWLCEGESTAPYNLLHGASGFTSGVANVAPALSQELYARAMDGDYVRAGEVQRLLDPWAELRAKPGNHVGVIKLALDLCHLAGGPVRLPLLPLNEAEQAEVRRLVESTPGVSLVAAS